MGEADLAGSIGRPPAPHPAIRLIKVRREGFGGFHPSEGLRGAVAACKPCFCYCKAVSCCTVNPDLSND